MAMLCPVLVADAPGLCLSSDSLLIFGVVWPGGVFVMGCTNLIRLVRVLMLWSGYLGREFGCRDHSHHTWITIDAHVRIPPADGGPTRTGCAVARRPPRHASRLGRPTARPGRPACGRKRLQAGHSADEEGWAVGVHRHRWAGPAPGPWRLSAAWSGRP